MSQELPGQPAGQFLPSPAPTWGCSQIPLPQPLPLLSACCPSHMTHSTQPTKEKPRATNPSPGGGRRRGWRAELKACAAQPASSPPCRHCPSPSPLATGTPCRGRMEDLGKPGPSGAIPMLRLGAGSSGGSGEPCPSSTSGSGGDAAEGAAMELYSLPCLPPSQGTNGAQVAE